MSVKEFGVEFYHEKAFRDLGSGFVVVKLIECGAKKEKNIEFSIE